MPTGVVARITVAVIFYLVATAVVCVRFDKYRYDDVKGLHKLAGVFIGLACIGLALEGSDAIRALSFAKLSPWSQYPIVTALVIWSYLGYVKVRGGK